MIKEESIRGVGDPSLPASQSLGVEARPRGAISTYTYPSVTPKVFPRVFCFPSSHVKGREGQSQSPAGFCRLLFTPSHPAFPVTPSLS